MTRWFWSSFKFRFAMILGPREGLLSLWTSKKAGFWKSIWQCQTDYKTQRSNGESGSKHSKDRSSTYQNETTEPCYFSSSIYYGGQEVYSPNSQTKNSHHTFKKDGGGDDSNGII